MRSTCLAVWLGFLALAPAIGTAQTPVPSFEQLPDVAAPGMTVVVKTTDGGSATGKIVSLTGSAIEIDRQLSFFRVRRVSFAADSVRRVEKRDSTWNGALIGLGIGGAVTTGTCISAFHTSDGWACLFWAALAPAAGVAVGELVDRTIRASLYISPSRVRLQPVGGAHQVGVVARIAF